MESESIIKEMLEYPMLPLYVCQKLLGADVPHSITTRGPLGITNIFLEDYLTVSSEDFASARVMHRGLVEQIPALRSIPLFDVVAVMNWYERKGSQASTLHELYDLYYGPYDGKKLTDTQAKRVDTYWSKYPGDDDYWLNK
jgi:hypothetical protein